MHHLPENVDWNDTIPQRSLDSLVINAIWVWSLSVQRAILYTAQYLVKEFKSLGNLQKFLPLQS